MFLLVTLLDKGKADALGLGEGDQGLLGLTNDENVGETGGEGVATGVLDVGDLVGTGVVLDVLENTDSTDIVSSLDENRRAVFVFDNAVNFTSLKVEL